MTVHYADDMVTLHHGEALDVLRGMPAASIDAICVDPPYGLSDHAPATIVQALQAWVSGDREHVPGGKGFMGREWDRFVPPPAVWDECLRVLKPGGHLLAFAGARTQDLMAMSIRLAGFEIRDGIDWLYASGFPKSLDVSKAIDRRRDDRGAALTVAGWLAAARDKAGWTNKQIDAMFGFNGMAGHWTARPDMKICHVPTWDQWCRLQDALGFGDEMDAEVLRLNGRKGQPGEAWSQREVIGERMTGRGAGRGAVAYIGDSDNRTTTAPATDDAVRWSGWGTALKPAREPIVVARKPFAGTVAANVLAYGTGALNIDACRTAAGQDYREKCASVVGLDSNRNGDAYGEWAGVREDGAHVDGRWPTNVVFSHAATPDGVDLCGESCVPGCPIAEMDQQSGVTVSRVGQPRGGASGNGWRLKATGAEYDDAGGASRFFPAFRYGAKASTAERPRDGQTAHPTVKPLELMRWLVRLITPPGGTVLDFCAGSGTTGEACVIEGFPCVLVEREAAYLPLIVARLTKPLQPALDVFGGVA